MNDPWADVRGAIVEFKERRGSNDTFKVERLLADADALLAVVGEYHEMIRLEWVKADEEGRTEQTLNEWIANWYPKLAALSEHLNPRPTREGSRG